MDNLLSNIKVPEEIISCECKSCDCDWHMFNIDSLGDDHVQSSLSQQLQTENNSQK